MEKPRGVTISLSLEDEGPSFDPLEGYGVGATLKVRDEAGEREYRLFVPDEPPREPEAS